MGFWSSAFGGGIALNSIRATLAFRGSLAFASSASRIGFAANAIDLGVNSLGAYSAINGISNSAFYNNTNSDRLIGLTGGLNSGFNGFRNFPANNGFTIGLNAFSIGITYFPFTK